MRSVFISREQIVGQDLHNLWANGVSLPHVVFATASLRTSDLFVRSLSEFCAQVCARLFYVFVRSYYVFIHTFHSPNNSYSKGDTL